MWIANQDRRRNMPLSLRHQYDRDNVLPSCPASPVSLFLWLALDRNCRELLQKGSVPRHVKQYAGYDEASLFGLRGAVNAGSGDMKTARL